MRRLLSILRYILCAEEHPWAPRLLLGLMLLSAVAHANPTFVKSGTGTVNVGTSITVPLTVGSNTDEVIVVVVAEQTAATVSGIQWNGHAFSKVNAVASSTGVYFGSELWYYVAGNTSGQASNVTITVGAASVAAAVVGEYKLVNQSTPFPNNAVANAQNSPLNTNITVSNNGSLTLDCVAFYSSVSLSNSDFTNRGGVASSLVVAGLLERGPYSPGTQTANDTFNTSPCYSSHVVAELQGDNSTPTPTPTSTPTWTPTFTLLPTASYTNTPTPSITPTVTKTATPTATPTRTRTFTVSPTISPTFTVSPTPTISPTFSVSPTISPTFTITATFTLTPTITPTFSPTPTCFAGWTPWPTPPPVTWTPRWSIPRCCDW